jgi:hypothetical protein
MAGHKGHGIGFCGAEHRGWMLLSWRTEKACIALQRLETIVIRFSHLWTGGTPLIHYAMAAKTPFRQQKMAVAERFLQP